MPRRLVPPLVALLAGALVAVGCGGASDTDFGNGDGSSDTGGNGGSSRGGSDQGGSAQGGSGGTSSGSGGGDQGGSGAATGGSTSGGSTAGGSTGTGGESGTATGGATTGGSGGGGTGGTDPLGGTGGAMSGGTGPGGSGGVSGRGGGGGQGGNNCATIVSNAQAALLAAQVCDPRLSVERCTGKVEDLCGCIVPVNDADSPETKSYLAQREAAVRCGVPCLAIPCREPPASATCGIGGATTNIVVARSYCAWPPR